MIANDHTVLKQTVRSLACNPGDFTNVVEVRVEAHLLRHLSSFVRQFD